MFNLFKPKDKNSKKTKKSNSVVSNVLKILGLNDSFNHENDFVDWVAEHNANLFNVPVRTKYSTINNYLVNNNYQAKNWLSIFKKSKFGNSAYLIFSIESKLFFQRVNLSNRKYDITGKLVEATIFYEPYQKNSIEVLLYENYKIIGPKKVTVSRYFYEMKNGAKGKKIKDEKFQDYILNKNLKNTQDLEIDYLPIAPMKNKANEESDCALAQGKIKTLDIFFEQIILDIVVNSPKFLFVNVYGNEQSQLEDAVRKLIIKNYLFTDDLQSIQILEGKFKGKTLTDVVDWMFNEISKRIFLYIPSQKKSAQQTQGETESVNIATINAVEQKMLQYRIDTFNFLKILIDFDNDVLNGATFDIKEEVTIENLQLEMDIINPGTNQLVGEDYGTRQNNIS